LSSLLYSDLREKTGLVYVVSSFFDLLALRGPFIIALQTKPTSKQSAIQAVEKTLQAFIQNGPTDAQLKTAKDSLIAHFPLALSTNNGILEVVSNMVFYHRPLDYLDTYRDRVQAVTVDQVKAAFQKNIHPNKMAIVAVGPS